MIKVVNNCVGCAMGCIHCGKEHEIEYICDECGDEADELYEYYGEQLCLECLKARSKVE